MGLMGGDVMERWLLALLLVGVSSSAEAATYTVRASGGGHYTTIQACASAAVAGDTCLVEAGTYAERVSTVRDGTGAGARITFRANGPVTMYGFVINHQYVTVDGFTVDGRTNDWLDPMVLVYANGDYCEVLNNTLKNGAPGRPGHKAVQFYVSRGAAASACTVRGNTITNLKDQLMDLAGDHHLIEGNTLSNNNSFDFIRLFGNSLTIRRNVFRDGTLMSGAGNHPDIIQTFGQYDRDCQDIVFEENWIQNVPGQLGQLNSGYDAMDTFNRDPDVKNLTIRRNVYIDVKWNFNIDIPGVVMENNTFYRSSSCAAGVPDPRTCEANMTGLNFAGSLTRGEYTGLVLRNNVFLEGGHDPTVSDGRSGFYDFSGATFSREVITVVTGESCYGSPSGCPIGNGIYLDLINKGYLTWSEELTAAAHAMSDISQFTLDPAYATFKAGVYDALMDTRALDRNMLTNRTVDYNYVAGAASAGYPAKRTGDCGGRTTPRHFNFCETQAGGHGINGGDPRMQGLSSVLGPDGVPFTTDDGLKPVPTSRLCGAGYGGADIGAYSCLPGVVFSGSGGAPAAPSGVVIR